MKSDDFSQKLGRIDRAMADVEFLLDGERLEAARALVSAILDVHHDALEELFEAASGSVGDTLAALAYRPRIAWLLGLHGVNPAPLEGRARKALHPARAELAFEDLALEPSEPELFAGELLIPHLEVPTP